MDMGLILSFLGIAILLTLMPGPDILFVMVQSMLQDKKAGIVTALGLCTGLVVHITAATIGISAIIYQSALGFMVVKYAGALYLLYLAWQAYKDKEFDFSAKSNTPIHYRALYQRGILMNILNPKVALFFLALLPQFVDHTVGYVTLQMLILGSIFIVQAFVIFTIVSVYSAKISVLLSTFPTIGKRLNLFRALLLGLIALQVAFSER